MCFQGSDIQEYGIRIGFVWDWKPWVYQGSSRVANHESVRFLILVKERDIVHEVFKNVDISTC